MRYNLDVDDDLKEELEKEAKESRRSLAQYIQFLCETHPDRKPVVTTPLKSSVDNNSGIQDT